MTWCGRSDHQLAGLEYSVEAQYQRNDPKTLIDEMMECIRAIHIHFDNLIVVKAKCVDFFKFK